MKELEREIRDLIIRVLSLEEVRPEDLGAETRLFEDSGLGLDSIDGLEIGVAIQRTYGVKINQEDKSIAAHFQCIRTLSNFVAMHRQQ